jgi:spore maturation protein CgeB
MPETVKYLKNLGIIRILWTIDPPRFFQPLIDVAPFYDHIFCQGTEAIKLLDSVGIKGAQWLPMACDPDYHHPVECTAEQSDKYGSDVVFVGSYYPERAALFERLSALSSCNLAIWGPGWDALDRNSPLRRCVRGLHTTPDEWLKIYSVSKIVLATHYHDPNNSFPVYQASPRVFEALACRAFVLCDDQRDVFSFFKDGEDLVKFNDSSDLVRKVHDYLDQSGKRNVIAERGYQKVLNHHTYPHRIKQLLSSIGYRA